MGKNIVCMPKWKTEANPAVFAKKMSARNAAAAIESATKSVFAKSFGKIKQ